MKVYSDLSKEENDLLIKGLLDISQGRIKPFNQIKEEVRMEDDRYSFVSAEKDVDYLRVVKEAPKGTQFILVEERNRFNHRPRGWVLLVHNDILQDPKAKHHILVSEDVDADWGSSKLPDGRDLFSYRYASGDGKFPGWFRQDIERIKMFLKGKDTVTSVEYK